MGTKHIAELTDSLMPPLCEEGRQVTGNGNALSQTRCRRQSRAFVNGSRQPPKIFASALTELGLHGTDGTPLRPEMVVVPSTVLTTPAHGHMVTRHFIVLSETGCCVPRGTCRLIRFLSDMAYNA